MSVPVSALFRSRPLPHPISPTANPNTAVFPRSCLSRRLRKHAAEDVYEVVQSQQVAVLPVALHPGSPVVQGLRGLQGDRLPEVDHPHSGFARGVVHKQQRAAHHLLHNDPPQKNQWVEHTEDMTQPWRRCRPITNIWLDRLVCLEDHRRARVSHLVHSEEVRLFEDRAELLQPLQVGFLGGDEKRHKQVDGQITRNTGSDCNPHQPT